MQTVTEDYRDPNNDDCAPLVEAVADIMDHISKMSRPQEDLSPVLCRTHRPAVRTLFHESDSAPSSLPRLARSPSPARAILKHPCKRPGCTNLARPETGYCAAVCELTHNSTCKNAKHGCTSSSHNGLPGTLCAALCPFDPSRKGPKEVLFCVNYNKGRRNKADGGFEGHACHVLSPPARSATSPNTQTLASKGGGSPYAR